MTGNPAKIIAGADCCADLPASRRAPTAHRIPAGAARGRFGGAASGQQDDKPADPPRSTPGGADELRARVRKPRPGRRGLVLSPQDRGSLRPGPLLPAAVPPLPEGAADMPGQQTCAAPVIVTLPDQLDTAAAERAADQITSAF